jgi:hypothetical protein
MDIHKIHLEISDMYSVNYSAYGTKLLQIFPLLQHRRWLWSVNFPVEGKVESEIAIPAPVLIGISRMKCMQVPAI